MLACNGTVLLVTVDKSEAHWYARASWHFVYFHLLHDHQLLLFSHSDQHVFSIYLSREMDPPVLSFLDGSNYPLSVDAFFVSSK